MRSNVRLAVCVLNLGYEASLEIGKFYRIISDESAEAIGYLRVVDDGADCGYPADRFFVLDQDDAEKGVIRGEKADMKVDLSVIRANMRLTATERARQADRGRRVALAAQHRGGE